MKRYFILFAIASSLNCISMEDPRSLQDVYETLKGAFEAFGLDSEGYSINTYHQELTPKADVPRWNVTSSHIEITRDIRQNPHLVEFAAYCAAADVKNYGSTKRAAALFGIYGLSLTPLAAVAATTSHHCSSLLFALPLVPVAVTYCNLDARLLNLVEMHLETHAFAQACHQLVEKKKFATLAMYYAFAKKIAHTPLKRDDQYRIIEQSLKTRNYSIQSTLYAHSTEVTILDQSEKTVGSAFYPPPVSK